MVILCFFVKLSSPSQWRLLKSTKPLFSWIKFQSPSVCGPLLAMSVSGFLEVATARGMWLADKEKLFLSEPHDTSGRLFCWELLFIESLAEKITFSYTMSSPFCFLLVSNQELKWQVELKHRGIPHFLRFHFISLFVYLSWWSMISERSEFSESSDDNFHFEH